ncbi:MAG TPA: phosphotransferase, partial [Anaerolineales bacterium]|nr:phosphotransferase [Anaerolineales bacterium]
SLFEAYCKVWEPKWFEERVCGFHKQPPKPWIELASWPRLRAPEPITWLIEQVAGSADASRLPHIGFAVTHGDLHGDNLLVDQDHHAWVIDFERSGPGPVLQDLVELEADILNRLTCALIDPQTFYRVCILITQDAQLQPLIGCESFSAPATRKTLEVISTLRRLASQHIHPASDAREYLWGLLFNTLFRATIMSPDSSDGRERAFMLAGILCQRLENWGAAWPPAQWPAAC